MDHRKRGGAGKQSKADKQLAELFAQQQQQLASTNPLTLLQQMNALMQPGNPAASLHHHASQPQPQQIPPAWWYLEYLTRIQAAQMSAAEKPSSSSSSANNSTSTAAATTPAAPPPSSGSNHTHHSHGHGNVNASSSNNTSSSGSTRAPHHPPPAANIGHNKRAAKRQIRDHQDILNLSQGQTQQPLPSRPLTNRRASNSSTTKAEKKPKISSSSASSAASTASHPTPPMAHSTPINLSTPPGKFLTASTPPPAHKNNTQSELYTHMIPKSPPVGLIVKKKFSRPWAEELKVPQSVDYKSLLTQGWRRETMVKRLEHREGVVSYYNPAGVKFKNATEVKKGNLNAKLFNFNSGYLLGDYVYCFEGERVVLKDSEVGDALKLLRERSAKIKEEREVIRLRMLKEEKEKLELKRKSIHEEIVKRLSKCKRKKRVNNSISPDNDEFKGELAELKKVLEESESFFNVLQVHEFLKVFGETLGFDTESLPSLENLFKGFLGSTEQEEELISILIHLVVCAVEDPGMPNPQKHLTCFNQTLKQADVTFATVSEVLRVYLESLDEEEEFSEVLKRAPFNCLSVKLKSRVLAFLADLLLSNKAVLKQLETSSELIHNCKKERQTNEVKIRKLRMLMARKAVASACEENNDNNDEDLMDDFDLSIDEIKSKMAGLNATNDKLKKTMLENVGRIRSICLGEDRFRRRYFLVPELGDGEGDGVVIAEGCGRHIVRKHVSPVEPTPVTTPAIRIFNLKSKENCTGRGINLTAADEENFVKNAKFLKGVWVVEDVEAFCNLLNSNGIREGALKRNLEEISYNNSQQSLDYLSEMDSFGGPDVDETGLTRTLHGLMETLETLEERVAGASLQVKGWVVPAPISREDVPNALPMIKKRLLELEEAVERRYLKPPLGKSAGELNLSNLVGEDNASAISSDVVVGSTSSTRGQQILENNKMKELKEKEERLEKEQSKCSQNSRFLLHWRETLYKDNTTLPTVSMAIYLLDSSIAWDKSVMKACCQLCKGGDNEDKLLLCDACDRGYHTYCFKPPLEQIPDGDWFCWECINKATGNRGCIVCGKGSLAGGKKLLQCDKCIKAFHTDCLNPPLAKIPRGRWYCYDHTTLMKSTSSPKKGNTSTTQPKKGSSTTKNKAKEEMDWCEKTLEALMQHEDAWPFLEPVNTRQFPTYKKVIKTPMDLSTIKKSLPTYKAKENFLQDICLIFDNCETFNEDDSPVGKAGHNLRVFFDSLLSSSEDN